MTPLLKAVTFDFWQTLFMSPDEELNTARRVADLVSGLAGSGHCVPPEDVRAALDACRRLTMDRQYYEGTDLGPEEQVTWIVQRLGIDPDPDLVACLVPPYISLLLSNPPQLLPGARPAVEALAGRYRLAIICNTGATPGSVLRTILEREGLTSRFTVALFSNELRLAKPNPIVFRRALAELGVYPEEAVHVGDDVITDVGGAKRAGMRAIWFNSRGAIGEAGADATITDLVDLPGTVQSLDGV